ncbi:hypothetical protein PMIT1320_02353 [Prochlorococcus marinus str. MIT 1320]|nr:hypothetical protein PMIT1320_02353 [Prochlorococcus marinus str. MIT 1320]
MVNGINCARKAGRTAMTRTNSTTQKGVFLLGIGAQKAITSWLHLQLHNRADANFGFCKEYHIHDALTVPKLVRYSQQQGSWLKPRTLRRQRFFKDIGRYYDYFCSLLSRPPYSFYWRHDPLLFLPQCRHLNNSLKGIYKAHDSCSTGFSDA